MTLPSLQGYLNWAEVKKSWIASGASLTLVSGAIILLQTLAANQTNIIPNATIAGLAAFILTGMASKLILLKQGMFPTTKPDVHA